MLEQFEAQIQAYMAAAQVPGLALALIQDGQVAFSQGYGTTSVEDGGLPITPQTLFRIGSITKPLTGTAIMRLVEQGLLDLDRPLRAYVPWLTFSQPDVAQRITLRMLLSHTAGLPVDYGPFGWRDPSGLESYVRTIIPRYPLLAPPGRLYSYSNPGINLAGYIAEVAAGRPFAALLQELLLDPLDMRRTTCDPAVAMTYPLALPHDRRTDGALCVRHRFQFCAASNPSGEAFSTVRDLASFALLQLNGGRFSGQPILTPGSLAEMQRLQADLYTVDRRGYGLALRLWSYKGLRLAGHAGLLSTYRSRLVLAPEAGAALILLCNRNPAEFEAPLDALLERMLDHVLGLPARSPARQSAPVSRMLWPRLVGEYLSPYKGLACIRLHGDRLVLELNGELLPLSPLRNQLYVAERAAGAAPISVGFVPGARGPVHAVMVDGTAHLRIERPPDPEPDPACWEAYAGQYRGLVEGDPEVLTVRVDGGALQIQSLLSGRQYHCLPLDQRRFVCAAGLYEFVADATGPAAAMRVWGYYLLQRSTGLEQAGAEDSLPQ